MGYMPRLKKLKNIIREKNEKEKSRGMGGCYKSIFFFCFVFFRDNHDQF